MEEFSLPFFYLIYDIYKKEIILRHEIHKEIC